MKGNATNAVSEWKWECLRLVANDNTETDTGWDLPIYGEIDALSMGVFVQTVDATETLNVGILSTETGGDADGFLVTLSIATAGVIKPSVAVTQGTTNAPYVTTRTFGALFYNGFDGSAGTAVTNVGVPVIKNYLGNGTAESITYTCTAGSDTFVGFLMFRWRQWPDLTNFLV